ncbi:MAG: WD40 repeat domain-containing protein [Cyanophyceae cyanobacterium]
MPKTTLQDSFRLLRQSALSDYVTAIAWSLDGAWFVGSSAAGEVVQCAIKTGETTVLLGDQGESVDTLAISADGQFLAAGGQAGTVWVWRLDKGSAALIEALEHSRVWIDCLQWNPQRPELASGCGRDVKVWDAADQSVTTTLNFNKSSVLDLAWHPSGDRLSVSGNQMIKTWQRRDWNEAPTELATGGVTDAIAWSPDGNYFAAGSNDRSVLVWEGGSPYPWQMQDFPGKLRQLAWSMPTKTWGAPLLASMGSQNVVVWAQDDDPIPELLGAHQGTVSAIAFQPQTSLLASAAEDGCLCLWHNGVRLVQTLKHPSTEFSCLAWSPSGEAIAAGGSQGELFVWTKTTPGKGFG